MNNTDLITIFRENLNPEAELLPLRPGPPELGGPTQQHLSSKFRLNTPTAYEEWAPKAMVNLAQMMSYSFPGPFEMFQLDDPQRDCAFWTVIEDPEICIRQYNVDMEEKWSEPNENAPADFKPRLMWEAHTRVIFEVVFQFSRDNEIQVRRLDEYPETD